MLHENAIQDRDRRESLTHMVMMNEVVNFVSATPTTETSDVGGGNSGVDDDREYPLD